MSNDPISMVGCTSRCQVCGWPGDALGTSQSCCAEPNMTTGIMILNEGHRVEFQSRDWLVAHLQAGRKLVDWLSGKDVTAFANVFIEQEAVSA